MSKFIVIEGIDGAGKGTHTRRLAQVLQESLLTFRRLAFLLMTLRALVN